MRLSIPAVQYANVFEKSRNLGIIQIGKRGQSGVQRPRVRNRRFAPELNGGALPRTPHSFRLSIPRFAARQIGFGGRKGAGRFGRASLWHSASCRWRCRPFQPRIGL